VKLVAATDDARSLEVGKTLVPVLHVTPSAVPVTAVSLSKTKISLLAVTAVVFTVQVAPVALVAQEKCPATAEAHDATDGLAAVPAAAQLVAVPMVLPSKYSCPIIDLLALVA
jgi:hypothetical protein